MQSPHIYRCAFYEKKLMGSSSDMGRPKILTIELDLTILFTFHSTKSDSICPNDDIFTAYLATITNCFPVLRDSNSTCYKTDSSSVFRTSLIMNWSCFHELFPPYPMKLVLLDLDILQARTGQIWRHRK